MYKGEVEKQVEDREKEIQKNVSTKIEYYGL